ncbi:Ragulator complex protein lamtor3 [Haplosporangium sp. Z 767]|nr:Ragulator complex protein lamtor3 [Haplosporangium sp. Z 767]KAF9182880.1 Ragulator complex protein lamtor3 [Haplosporangium sp. Z 11]
MAEELVVHFEKLLTRVDGLLSAIVTDRDGVVLLRANAPNCSLPFTESALGCTFALASDQASKLGLKKNKSILSIYGTYQLVQFNHSSLITTFVANSNANTGLLLELGSELESVTQVIAAALHERHSGAL